MFIVVYFKILINDNRVRIFFMSSLANFAIVIDYYMGINGKFSNVIRIGSTDYMP